jgi:hypothetical protein
VDAGADGTAGAGDDRRAAEPRIEVPPAGASSPHDESAAEAQRRGAALPLAAAQTVAASALRYLLDEDDQDWLFSLTAVAEQMGEPPEEVRQKVKAMVEQADKEAAVVKRFRYSRWTRVGDGRHRKPVNGRGAGRPRSLERLRA